MQQDKRSDSQQEKYTSTGKDKMQNSIKCLFKQVHIVTSSYRWGVMIDDADEVVAVITGPFNAVVSARAVTLAHWDLAKENMVRII